MSLLLTQARVFRIHPALLTGRCALSSQGYRQPPRQVCIPRNMSETPPPPVPYLPDIRRIVTGHNQNGTAITIQDDVVKATFWSSQNPSAMHGF